MKSRAGCADRRESRSRYTLLMRDLVFLFLFTALSAFAAKANAQSFSFSTVDISGNDRVETGTILSYAAIPAGQTLGMGEINAAYQRVVQSGLFETVEMDPRGSTLVIRVVEWPTINRIRFEGNNRLSDDELGALIESKSRRVYSPTVAARDAATLVDAYELKGRFAATVSPRIIRRDGNRVDLVFEVAEGKVVEIERLSFVGNSFFKDRRLRQVLQTKQASIIRNFVYRDTFVAERLEFDKQLLTDYYNSHGFVDFRVLGVSTEFSRERNAFFVTFNVEEGQIFTFGEVTVSSDIDGVDAGMFFDRVRARSGRTYSPVAIEQDVARMEQIAIREGMNFIVVEPVITRDDANQVLDVNYVISRGPRVFVERIDIEGNQTTLDRVVRRQFRVVEGDPFNPREIRQAAERIRALAYFDTVDVNVRDGSSSNQAIVDVNVVEGTTGSLSFGATYSSDTGPGLNLSYSERNFLGRGQTLRFTFTGGTSQSETSVEFVEPYLMGRDLELGARVFYEVTNLPEFFLSTKVAGFAPTVAFPVGENARLGLNFSLSQDEIFDVDPASSAIIQAEAGTQLTSQFGYSIARDTRNSGLNPNGGVLLRFGQQLAGLGGDTKYLETTATVVGEARMTTEDVVFRAVLEGGSINSVAGGVTRVTDRFFLSTSQLRGFAPKGIGPRDTTAANSDPLGGNMYAVARLETEFPLGIPEEFGLRGALYFDAGSVWGLDNTAGTGGTVDDAFHLRSSVGVSVLWDSPIGPLRFNLAQALSKLTYDEVQQFNIAIQTEF